MSSCGSSSASSSSSLVLVVLVRPTCAMGTYAAVVASTATATPTSDELMYCAESVKSSTAMVARRPSCPPCHRSLHHSFSVTPNLALS